MYRFQEILLGADRRGEAQRSTEEKVAGLVAAAESTLPMQVLYPEPGSVMEVDALTGYALEEIWRETAEIYGSEYAPEMSDPEKNPLCRGIYVCDPPSPSARYQLLDNVYGMALVAYPNSKAVAMAVARAAATDPSIAIENEIAKLEATAVKKIESGLATAIEQEIQAAGNNLLEAARKEACDPDTLAANAERLSNLKKISEMMKDGALPIDGRCILEHAGTDLETIMSDEYLSSLAVYLADASSDPARKLALKEKSTDPEFWAQAFLYSGPPEGLDDLARSSATAAEAIAEENNRAGRDEDPINR